MKLGSENGFFDGKYITLLRSFKPSDHYAPSKKDVCSKSVTLGKSVLSIKLLSDVAGLFYSFLVKLHKLFKGKVVRKTETDYENVTSLDAWQSESKVSVSRNLIYCK